MQLSITDNLRDVQKQIDQLGKKANSAVRESLNRTAEWVATEVRREMPKVFDRPVPFTLKSLRVFYANSNNLRASVWFRQRSADLDKLWAAAQVGGGQRGVKPLERRLQRIGVLPKDWYMVPGGGAPTDAYGNMSAGEISRILNVLGALTEPGYNKADDKTRARLRKGNVKKNIYGFEYFVVKPGSRRAAHLLPGVYRRVYTAFGTSLKPMMIFVQAAKYKKRLDFQGITRRTIDKRFPLEFAKAFESIQRTGSASGLRRGVGR